MLSSCKTVKYGELQYSLDESHLGELDTQPDEALGGRG